MCGWDTEEKRLWIEDRKCNRKYSVLPSCFCLNLEPCWRQELTFNREWSGCSHCVIGSILSVCEFTCVVTFIFLPHIVNEQVWSMGPVLWSLKRFAVLKQQQGKHSISLPLSFSLSTTSIVLILPLSPQISTFYLKPLNRCCPIIKANCWASYLGIFFWSSYCWVHQITGNATAWRPFMYGDIHVSSRIQVWTIERRQAFKK